MCVSMEKEMEMTETNFKEMSSFIMEIFEPLYGDTFKFIMNDDCGHMIFSNERMDYAWIHDKIYPDAYYITIALSERIIITFTKADYVNTLVLSTGDRLVHYVDPSLNVNTLKIYPAGQGKTHYFLSLNRPYRTCV